MYEGNFSMVRSMLGLLLVTLFGGRVLSWVILPSRSMICLYFYMRGPVLFVRCRWGETTSLNCGYQQAPDDVRAWITMVEIYWLGKTSESSTRELWQSYEQSNLVAKQEEREKKIMNVIFHIWKCSLTCHKILWQGPNALRTPPLLDKMLIALRNPSPSAGFEPAKLGWNGKRANHCTTEDYSRKHC
jgi:hypothetical protein